MKIKELADKLFKAYKEAGVKDYYINELVSKCIKQTECDLLFAGFSDRDIVDYDIKGSNRIIQEKLTKEPDYLFGEMLKRRLREKNYKIRPNTEGKDEYDYANMAPDRRKNYYYE